MEKIQGGERLDNQMCMLERSSCLQVEKRLAVGGVKKTGAGDSGEEVAQPFSWQTVGTPLREVTQQMREDSGFVSHGWGRFNRTYDWWDARMGRGGVKDTSCTSNLQINCIMVPLDTKPSLKGWKRWCPWNTRRALSNMVATSHTWLWSAWNGASMTEDVNFSFYFILIAKPRSDLATGKVLSMFKT